MSAVFRATEPTDAASFLTAVQSNAATLMPWVDTPLRVTDLESASKSVNIKLSDGRPARFGAFIDGRLAGSTKLIELDTEVPDMEIGIWCIPEFRGKGIARWMMAKTIDVAFTYGAERVTVRHAAGNTRTYKLNTALGITLEGRLRHACRIKDELQDVVLWGVLRPDWPTVEAEYWYQQSIPKF